MKFLPLLLISVSIFASQADNFGLGGITSARVNTVTAEPNNPYAALYNPALMSLAPHPLFAFSTSVATTSFGEMNDILVRSPVTGELRRQNFKLPDASSTLWAVGFTYPFQTPALFSRRAAVGITLSGPFSRLRSFTSRAPDELYSLRYGSSDSQFKTTLAASLELWPSHLFFGAGVSFFLSSMGKAETEIGTTPSARMAMDIGLESALNIGLVGKWDKTTAGLTFRNSINPTFTQAIEARVRVGEATFRQPVLIKSSLYYEPQSFVLEGQHDFDSVIASMGVSYQIWHDYVPPVIVAETVNSDGLRVFSETQPPSLRNTLSPRASLVFPTFERRLFVSTGYEYRPTPVTDLSGGANLLDANSHLIGLGFEHHVPGGEFLQTPFKWGLFSQIHLSEAREVTKINPQSTGGGSYKYQATTYTYGLFLQAEL